MSYVIKRLSQLEPIANKRLHSAYVINGKGKSLLNSFSKCTRTFFFASSWGFFCNFYSKFRRWAIYQSHPSCGGRNHATSWSFWGPKVTVDAKNTEKSTEGPASPVVWRWGRLQTTNNLWLSLIVNIGSHGSFQQLELFVFFSCFSVQMCSFSLSDSFVALIILRSL